MSRARGCRWRGALRPEAAIHTQQQRFKRMLRQFVEGAERGMLATLVLVLIGSAGARAEDQGAQAANGTPAAAATTPSPAGPVTGAPGAVAATPLPPGMVPGDIVEQGPIEELTEVFGKIDPKLKGVWLLRCDEVALRHLRRELRR